MAASNRLSLCRLIQKNTTTMWGNLDLTRYPIVFCNWDWTKPYTGEDSDASMGSACCGASLMENSARLCRAIIDRYDLGALYAECSSLSIQPGHENDAELAAFNAAMANAAEILAAPSDYLTYQFKQAIENLQAAYPGAQEYATGINEISNEQLKIKEDIYDLSGRRMGKGNLPRGIYIQNGRKVLR